jgi:hypothetical protein
MKTFWKIRSRKLFENTGERRQKDNIIVEQGITITKFTTEVVFLPKKGV